MVVAVRKDGRVTNVKSLTASVGAGMVVNVMMKESVSVKTDTQGSGARRRNVNLLVRTKEFVATGADASVSSRILGQLVKDVGV